VVHPAKARSAAPDDQGKCASLIIDVSAAAVAHSRLVPYGEILDHSTGLIESHQPGDENES
jgi:hypothetical protein